MNEESRELLQEIHEMRHRMEALEAKMDDVLSKVDQSVERWTWDRYERIRKELLPQIDKGVERWTWERYTRMRRNLREQGWDLYTMNPEAVKPVRTNTEYDIDFFMEIRYGSVQSAEAILSRVFNYLPHKSVVDFGCGTGTWLWVAKAFGAQKVLGIDGTWVPKNLLMIDEQEFLPANLEAGVSVPHIWGTQFAIEKNREFLRTALLQRKEIVVAEMGFLNRVAWPDPDDCFRQSVSYVFDDLAPYYDARRPSRLEQMLEDEVFHLSVAECQRASACMETIRNECLTKYNHQPLDVPSIGRPGVRKILVVDQVVGDMSISKGLANAASFRKMLETACREHPEDDIIIKTHPDNITAHLRGFYEDIQPHDHVYLLRDAVNPIALLKTCDEVYVCTSQLGMEALILKKPVHVFGMPFYAGWGLTDDYMTCPRRTHHRSLEELFYITYIRYSWYVDPRTGRPCEIEDAMDYLLQMREAYFSRS